MGAIARASLRSSGAVGLLVVPGGAEVVLLCVCPLREATVCGSRSKPTWSSRGYDSRAFGQFTASVASRSYTRSHMNLESNAGTSLSARDDVP